MWRHHGIVAVFDVACAVTVVSHCCGGEFNAVVVVVVVDDGDDSHKIDTLTKWKRPQHIQYRRSQEKADHGLELFNIRLFFSELGHHPLSCCIQPNAKYT